MKSDHPVLDSRYLPFEAQQAHHFGLDWNLALASVTSSQFCFVVAAEDGPSKSAYFFQLRRRRSTWTTASATSVQAMTPM
jgi:hypothetical protein